MLLLNPAHYWNTIWPNQIGFVLATCLVCCAVLILALPGEKNERKHLALGPVVLLTGMCGGNGLPLALALSPMLIWIGIRSFRAARGRPWSLVPVVCGISVWVYTCIYFVGLKRDLFQPPPRPFVGNDAIIEGIKATAMTLGSSAEVLWPLSGWIVAALVIASSVVLTSIALKEPENRFCACGLLFGLIGGVGLAMGIGVSRTVLGPGAGFAPRYATLVAPILLVVFLTFSRFGLAAVREVLSMALFTSLCLVFTLNGGRSVSEIDALVADGQALEQQVARKVSIDTIAADHGSRWMFTADNFATNMRLLLDARTGIYHRHPPDGTK